MKFNRRLAALQYHEWVKVEGDIATIGITEHAQELLGVLAASDISLTEPWMLSKNDVEQTFIARLNNGEISKAYQGEHGVPALGWPQLEDHDQNAIAICGALHSAAQRCTPACLTPPVCL